MVNVVDESLRQFIPGRIGSDKDALYTFQNYAELFHSAYAGYFVTTFRIGLIATVIALLVSYPLAYFLARFQKQWVRTVVLALLISFLFLSSAVRVYALELTFGPIGLMKIVAGIFNVSTGSAAFAEILVIAGLIHYAVPVATLILVGAIQNVSPRLSDAAESLGASRAQAHLDVTVPLTSRGILSAFAICYTLSISAFIVPLILGRGRVVFVSNLIYNRFSEVANYPSGSAISLVMLFASLVLVYMLTRLLSRRRG